eukprot:765035-Hanusia_phi.AAC.8
MEGRRSRTTQLGCVGRAGFNFFPSRWLGYRRSLKPKAVSAASKEMSGCWLLGSCFGAFTVLFRAAGEGILGIEEVQVWKGGVVSVVSRGRGGVVQSDEKVVSAESGGWCKRVMGVGHHGSPRGWDERSMYHEMV